MRMKPIIAISVVCAAIMFVDAEAVVRRGSPLVVLPKTAELVPAETIVLVDISDFNHVRAQFERSSIYKLCKDPAMASFVESFAGKWRQKLQQDVSPVIEAILDANGLPEGRVAVAFVPAENAGVEQAMSVLVISQCGANTDGIKEAIEKMAAKPAYYFIDDCLIAGTDVNTVKFVVSRIKGVPGAKVLAADPDYIAAMSVVRPYHAARLAAGGDVDLYVNLKELLKRTADEDQKMMSNLGFDNVAGLGCSLCFGADGSGSLCAKAFLKTVGTRRGVLKMLETHSEAIRAPAFVPASAYSVIFLNVDVRQVFDEWCGIDPAFAATLQKPLVEPGEDGEPGVSLRQDIIEHLGSEIVIAQSINKPFSAGVMPSETLIAVAVSNRGALEKSLSRWMEPNNPEYTRELLGHTIYLLGPAGVPFSGKAAVPAGEQTSPGVAGMAFTTTDTHLILGREPAVERAIRTLAGAESEPVGSAEWFNAAKSAVPSVVGLAGFEDSSVSGELLWWMLKTSANAGHVDMGIGPGAAVLARPDLWQFGDFGLLPEFDAVRKYFGCSAFYGVNRVDGFLFEFKYLNPK